MQLDDVFVSFSFDGLAIRNDTTSVDDAFAISQVNLRPPAEESIAASVDVIGALENFYRQDGAKIRQMQRNIEELGYSFTYARLNVKVEYTLSIKNPKAKTTIILYLQLIIDQQIFVFSEISSLNFLQECGVSTHGRGPDKDSSKLDAGLPRLDRRSGLFSPPKKDAMDHLIDELLQRIPKEVK